MEHFAGLLFPGNGNAAGQEPRRFGGEVLRFRRMRFALPAGSHALPFDAFSGDNGWVAGQ